MRTSKKVLATAVGIVFAAIGTAASAGTFSHPLHLSSDKLFFATENFGPATITSVDYFRPSPGFQVTFTTTVGESGGYVVNVGGSVYIDFTLSGARLAQNAVAGDFMLGGLPGFMGWRIISVTTSGDGTQVRLHVENNTMTSQSIGSGATAMWRLGGVSLVPTNAYGTAGDQVQVSAAVREVPDNSFIDGATSAFVVATADAINGNVAANAGVRKIAVDPISQRKQFVGPSLYNNLGRISWNNISGSTNPQLQVNGTADYTVTSPAGRLMSATVTAGTGSFNAGTLFLSNNSDCAVGQFANFSYNAGRTVATISNISAAAADADPWVCYVVTGPAGGLQINEVTGITATSTLFAPVGLNDLDRTISGSLASILNDGTVIDTRMYIPAAVNQFGYGMSLRIINTGVTRADVLAQYIYDDGTLSTQAKIATDVAVDGYVMLDNVAIEKIIGAPNAAKGPNPRVRIIASTSSLRVQTYLRTNGIWAEISGGQGNSTPQPQNVDGNSSTNLLVIPAATNQ